MSGNHKNACADCPIGCHRSDRRKTGQAAAYETLWRLALEPGQMKELTAAFHHGCDDIGLDAFETARAIGQAMEAGAMAHEASAVLQALEEVNLNTELGRVLGGGSSAAFAAWGVAAPSSGLKKPSGRSSDEEALLDSIGLCSFAARAFMESIETRQILENLLKAKYGRDFHMERFTKAVQEALNAEQKSSN